ncbi:MAG: hypothetical protein JWO36_6771 [Myxococcales bacterium]|nr:hypothetical protein [Myxococcales bacterium]
MRKLHFLGLLIALSSVVACAKDPIPPIPPVETANGVFPSEGFTGRKLRVEVSGDNTNWSQNEGGGPTVAFGDGITVDSVDVASPTLLFANITIAGTAAVSARDVTVTFGMSVLTLKAAFNTLSPVDFIANGALAQGAITTFTIKNKDLENLFDTTSTGDGFFTPLVFTNIAVTGPAGTYLLVSNVSPFQIDGTLYVDVDAQPGPISIASGPMAQTVTSVPASPLAVAARTATAVTPGSTTTGQITNPFDSNLYELTAASFPTLASISVTAVASAPKVAILPASGHFADLISARATNRTVVKSGKLYAIVFDISGDGGYMYSLKDVNTNLTAFADTEPTNNTSAGATAVTSPALIDNASIPAQTDQDWFKITVPVGKKIHVTTFPGDPRTDTFVTLYGPNNATTTFGPNGGSSSDANYHEDLVSPAATVAGTYYVEISASQDIYYDPAHNTYLATIVLE